MMMMMMMMMVMALCSPTPTPSAALAVRSRIVLGHESIYMYDKDMILMMVVAFPAGSVSAFYITVLFDRSRSWTMLY